jgi:SAM-dependent methyltransferase
VKKTFRYGKGFSLGCQEGSLQSAREIVPIVMDLVQPQSIIDVGCGTGTWLRVFSELGVKDYLGVDGEYVDRSILLIPMDRFMAHDLKKPLHLKARFDMVVSLEVAEHLPVECAETFVNSLTKLAPVILFAAAVPRQAKHKWIHPNEQWPDYWVNKFKQKGFIVVDCMRRKIWQNDAIAWWYAQNILMFVKSDHLEAYPLLKMEREKTFESQISVVHPRFFNIWSDLENLPLRRLFWLLKEILLAMSISMRLKVAGINLWPIDWRVKLRRVKYRINKILKKVP